MGAVVGLVFGAGLFLVWQSFTSPPHGPRRRRTSPRQRLQETLAQAGIDAVTPGALVAACASVGLLIGLVVVAVARSLPIGGAFALIGGYAPMAVVRFRQRRRQVQLRELWPEVVDNLASAVRAGLSLPEAISQLGVRGPLEFRGAFQRFGEDHRATGRFDEALDRLKFTLADPVGDRVVECVRMARAVGGSDLGSLLRTLSAFLREDARTRAELETRQGWTVNAARLAVAAPWIVLLMLATDPDTVRAYNTSAGLVVLAGGGGLCLFAYRLMVRIARLPQDERVLR